MKRALMVAALVPVVALASGIVPHSLKDRARVSNRVVLAQVTAQHTVMPANDPRQLQTVTEIVVGQDLKGRGPERLQIVQIGGTSGLWSVHVPGDAQFRLGETAVLFLSCEARGPCHLVALGEGKLNLDGDQVFVHDLFQNSWARRSLQSVAAEIAEASR